MVARFISRAHPTAKHSPPALARLDDFCAFNGFNQYASFEITQMCGTAGQFFNAFAMPDATEKCHQKKQNRNCCQVRMAHKTNQYQKDDHKRCVYHQVGGGSGEKAAHRLVGVHLSRQTPHTRGQLV